MPIITPSSSFSFLDAVNRILVANGIIRGDTDLISTFSDLQHGATVNMAQVAVQDELAELASDMTLPYERDATGSITTVAGTRSYSLPSDFTRFYGDASLADPNDWRIYEYPGGEVRLQHEVPHYKTTQSTPINWYFDATQTKKIGLWPVPSEAKTYTFDYQADVSVSASTDLLPFHNNVESYAFCRLAARRFKFLYEGMDPALMAADPEHMKAKATLVALIKGVNPAGRWAPIYR